MEVSSSLYSPFFSSDYLTPICAFNEENNPLDKEVKSDHAEVAFKIGEAVVNVWNISNPACQKYFQYGSKPPFHNTHLFVENPFVDGKMVPYLQEKHECQVNTIAERFVRGGVNIQVVVEGYESFFFDLETKIRSLGKESFQIISLLNAKPNNWQPEWNVTGILVDTSKFEVLSKGHFNNNYLEEQDANKEKELLLPFVHLENKKTRHKAILAGVHIAGCGSQYPKTGLETLAQTIKDLNISQKGQFDIIAAGDFNTTPDHARGSMINRVGTKSFILKAPYPTHVNPNSEAGNYDQVVILNNSGVSYVVLGEEHVSEASKALVHSIFDSRVKYFADQFFELSEGLSAKRSDPSILKILKELQELGYAIDKERVVFGPEIGISWPCLFKKNHPSRFIGIATGVRGAKGCGSTTLEDYLQMRKVVAKGSDVPHASF